MVALALNRLLRRGAGADAAIGCVLLVAGCGSDPGGTESSDSPGPLLGQDLIALARDEQVAVEESVRACMLERGFDYSPSQAVVGELSEAAYAKTYGYGVVVIEDEWRIETSVPTDEFEDELTAVESMSPAELDAWFGALEGSDETTGCRDLARSEIDSEAGSVAAVSDLLDEVYEQVVARPDVIALNQTWSACMAAAGYSYATPEAAQGEFLVEMAQQRAMIRQFRAINTEPSADGADFVTPALPAETLDVLESLAERERATAIADISCWEPLDATYDALFQQALEAATSAD